MSEISLSPEEIKRAKILFQEYIKTMSEEEAVNKCAENLNYIVKQADDDYNYQDAYKQ